MLDIDAATHYLIANKLVDVEHVIDGSLAITGAASRNRNLLVTWSMGRGVFLKQPDDSMADGHYTLFNEATVYRTCQENESLSGLTVIMPRLLNFDDARTILAIELVPDARTLWEYYEGKPAGTPAGVARALGRSLGSVHRTFSSFAASHDLQLNRLGQGIPWVLTIHKPSPGLLAVLSKANYQALHIIQADRELFSSLEGVRRSWSPSTLVHGDIRSDNILVSDTSDQPDQTSPEVRIIDWELAQFGDPAWDLAGAFQDLLLLWIRSMRVSADLTCEEMMATARHSVDSIQPEMRAIWHGYRTSVEIGSPQAGELLLRATRFTASRLIQSVFEMSREAFGLSATSVMSIQLAANILKDPESARRSLLGIP